MFTALDKAVLFEDYVNHTPPLGEVKIEDFARRRSRPPIGAEAAGETRKALTASIKNLRLDLMSDTSNRATGAVRHNVAERFLCLALSIGVAIVIVAPGVGADSDDADFLNAVHSRRLSNVNGDQGLINLGHMICGPLSEGYSVNALASSGALHVPNLSADDVEFLVQTSATTYCPEYVK